MDLDVLNTKLLTVPTKNMQEQLTTTIKKLQQQLLDKQKELLLTNNLLIENVTENHLQAYKENYNAVLSIADDKIIVEYQNIAIKFTSGDDIYYETMPIYNFKLYLGDFNGYISNNYKHSQLYKLLRCTAEQDYSHPHATKTVNGRFETICWGNNPGLSSFYDKVSRTASDFTLLLSNVYQWLTVVNIRDMYGSRLTPGTPELSANNLAILKGDLPAENPNERLNYLIWRNKNIDKLCNLYPRYNSISINTACVVDTYLLLEHYDVFNSEKYTNYKNLQMEKYPCTN